MLKFSELKKEAERRGCRLVRGGSPGCSIKSGYQLWKRNGLWVRCGTLQEVKKVLSTQF